MIFGLGLEARKYKPSSSSISSYGFWSHEYEKMKAWVSDLIEKDKNLKDMFFESHKGHFFCEQMTWFMENVSLNQTSQPIQCGRQP